MGNTVPLLGGGVDAVEGVFGSGRTPTVCRSAAGRRSDERGLSRVRHFAQDRLQDLEAPARSIPQRRVVDARGARLNSRSGASDANSMSGELWEWLAAGRHRYVAA